GSQSLCFGSKSVRGGVDTYDCQCGEYNFTNPSSDVGISSLNSMSQIANLIYGYAQSTYNTVNNNNPKNSETTIETNGSSVDMDKVCQVLSTTNTDQSTCIPAVSIWSYAANYMQFVSQTQSGQIDTSSTSNTSACAWAKSAGEQGWIMAASYYADLVRIGGACTTPNTVTELKYFLPKATGSNIITCNGVGSCKKRPCMTDASGYNNDLCKISYLDERVQSNWNSLYKSSTDDSNWTGNGMLQNMYANGSSNDKPAGIGYLESISTSSWYTDSTDSITTDTFDDYYNVMLNSFLKNFAINTAYEPDSVGYDIMTGGGQRFIVNGTATLVTYVIGEILGINIYSGQKPSDIFSYDVMDAGPPNPNSNCSTCYAGGTASYYSGLCYESESSSSCINGKGYGLFGQVAKEHAGEVYVDPLTSVATIGRNILKYTLGYQTNLIDNIFVGLRNFTTEIIETVIPTILVLSIPGFFGLFGGQTTMMFAASAMALVEILFKTHMILLFSYMPLAIALTIMFFTIGLMLGVYLPFLPYLLFTAGVISWFISVVEAMVAAPLVAMGVTHPKGHELMGRSEQALILLLSVFIRPSTMIIGFIAAIALSYASMYMLNLTFAYVFTEGLSSALAANSGYGTAILGGLLYVIIYAYSCYAILSQTYSLIFQVPDKVMRWIGMPRDTTGRDAMALAGGVKSGTMESGGGAAKEGVKGSMDQAKKGAPDLAALSELRFDVSKYEEKKAEDGDAEANDDKPKNDDDGISGHTMADTILDTVGGVKIQGAAENPTNADSSTPDNDSTSSSDKDQTSSLDRDSFIGLAAQGVGDNPGGSRGGSDDGEGGNVQTEEGSPTSDSRVSDSRVSDSTSDSTVSNSTDSDSTVAMQSLAGGESGKAGEAAGTKTTEAPKTTVLTTDPKQVKDASTPTNSVEPTTKPDSTVEPTTKPDSTVEPTITPDSTPINAVEPTTPDSTTTNAVVPPTAPDSTANKDATPINSAVVPVSGSSEETKDGKIMTSNAEKITAEDGSKITSDSDPKAEEIIKGVTALGLGAEGESTQNTVDEKSTQNTVDEEPIQKTVDEDKHKEKPASSRQDRIKAFQDKVVSPETKRYVAEIMKKRALYGASTPEERQKITETIKKYTGIDVGNKAKSANTKTTEMPNTTSVLKTESPQVKTENPYDKLVEGVNKDARPSGPVETTPGSSDKKPEDRTIVTSNAGKGAEQAASDKAAGEIAAKQAAVKQAAATKQQAGKKAQSDDDDKSK
ncbi:MAG: DotA/TraY family protein, partial [Legionellales bacterium]|nr:DotA/TraY family protein [Legionellales bacterium]